MTTLIAVACGGDDSASGSAAAYCAQVATLEAQESEPSGDQLDSLVAAAPDEIRADAQVLTDAIRTHDMEAEGVAEAEDRLLAFEADNC